MMSLDNRGADRQTDSPSIVLRCIESFEELVRDFRRETDSCIFHTKAHAIPLITLGSDQQLSRAIVNCAYRVRSVP